MHERARLGDPANAGIVIVAINSTDTVESIKDADTLAAILALAGTAEVSGGSGYARKVLSGVELNALVRDNVGNTQSAGFANDQIWTAVSGTTNWTHLVFCYDPDTTAGTDADLIPLAFGDFAKTPDGSDIILQAGNYFSAGE
ncbi:MAG: hypothetical protein D6698_15590 [Gammaproteobacteria bacterium]|nr:MAG: hypothetical protein D6698_15590 [Gammaproteobacteria bacterium]